MMLMCQTLVFPHKGFIGSLHNSLADLFIAVFYFDHSISVYLFVFLGQVAFLFVPNLTEQQCLWLESAGMHILETL